MLSTSTSKRGPGLAFGVALFALTPLTATAAPVNQPGWSATTQNITTGVLTGYETALDPVNRRVYAADAMPLTVERQYQWTAGTPPTLSTTDYTDAISQAATGKVVSIGLDTHALAKSYSFLAIPDVNGNPSSGVIPAVPGVSPAQLIPLTFGAPNATTGIASANNRQISNLPYGVAIDHGVADPIIVTTQTRTSTVAVFPASQAAPTPADIISRADLGLTGIQARTPVVDSQRHKAYIAGFNGANGVVVQVNTLTKAVEAVIPAPGTVGLALDVENNLLYAGSYQSPVSADLPNGHVLRVLDLSKVNTTSPLDKSLNAGVVVAEIPGVGENTRPGFDAKGKKVFLANSVAANPTVTVVDVDPVSANYRKVIKTIEVPGRPNAVAVDAERRLAYVPGLGGRVLSVLNADTLEFVQGIPTTGNAVDADVDPKTGTVYVSSQSTGTTTGVAQLQAITVSAPAPLPKSETGPAGAPGAAGTPGAPGKDGLAALQVSVSSLKLLGSKLSFQAPGAGVLKVSVKSGKRTIATGKRTTKKSGAYSLTLKRTAYGKSQLKKKTKLSGTLTATFTAAGTGTKTQTSVKTSLRG